MNFHEMRCQLLSLTHKWKCIKNGNISSFDKSEKKKKDISEKAYLLSVL